MKYYRMKIDKQGKTQKKQSKKNYRKTQKGGLMEFLRGKSHRGEVENIIHQLHKIIKYKEDKDSEINKLNIELDNFKKTIEDSNSLYESMLDKTTESLEKIISSTESISKTQ